MKVVILAGGFGTRLTEETARAERLTRLRAGDSRLDAAAEALDLELLE